MEGSENRTKLIVLAVFALLAAAVVAAILIGRAGGDDGDGGSATATIEGCEEVAVPEAKQVSFDKPKATVAKGERATALVETSCGDFEIALDTARAPKTANSFAFLAREGFFDGLPFHRVASGFVIQGGDPLGVGTGGPGYTVDEKPPANLAYTEGIVAMAKSGVEPPGRSGSQFFVVLGPDAGLPPDYALVGEVSSGMETVQRIGSLGTPEQKPKHPVLIEKVTIEGS